MTITADDVLRANANEARVGEILRSVGHGYMTVINAAELVRQLTAAGHITRGVPVAEVIEGCHDDLEARIRWLLNPMPVGSTLYEQATTGAKGAPTSAQVEKMLTEFKDALLAGDGRRARIAHRVLLDAYGVNAPDGGQKP